jgi:hypothetical protein
MQFRGLHRHMESVNSAFTVGGIGDTNDALGQLGDRRPDHRRRARDPPLAAVEQVRALVLTPSVAGVIVVWTRALSAHEVSPRAVELPSGQRSAGAHRFGGLIPCSGQCRHRCC